MNQDTYKQAVEKLTEAFGEPWIKWPEQARFDIATGHRHTAVDVFQHKTRALVSVHTLAPHQSGKTNQDHLEFVANLLEGCIFVQWGYLGGALARRHTPAPTLETSGD